MNKEKIRHYTPACEGYPEKLLRLPRPPKDIYVIGKLPEADKPTVAIVGARNASPYGRYMAQKFAYELSVQGVQIVSGFARGIDRAAHEGALQAHVPTFAVLGCGVDVCYPRENIDIYDAVAESGGFISEYHPGTEPLAKFFPMRNRLISAFADKILVVEARKRSGSLITADLALDQGKDVYAVPGRVDDALSEGCNRLIAQGANIAISAEDLLKDFEIDTLNFKSFRKKNELTLAPEEETVYSCIRLQPKHVEELLEQTQMGLSEILPILWGLETKKLVKEVTKNRYVRV